MNRFKYTAPLLIDGENTVAVENNVRLYDGDQKVRYVKIITDYTINGFFSDIF